jgi:hypothetical protein
MSTFRRWALNRADLILGILVLVTLTIVVCGLLGFPNGQQLLSNDPETRKGITVAILAGWGTISLACIGGAVKITAARQGLISLLSSEIKAIQYGLARLDMFTFWKSLYDNPEMGAIGFADAPRDENYFEIFHSVSNNIGNLHPQVVESIVRFYTYLKMSRDAAAALRSWKEQTDPAVRRLHVRYVVNLLGLSMLWGFVALWFMGFRAKAHDTSFLLELRVAYDAVIGADQFDQLWAEHVRKPALEGFFQDVDLEIGSVASATQKVPASNRS